MLGHLFSDTEVIIESSRGFRKQLSIRFTCIAAELFELDIALQEKCQLRGKFRWKQINNTEHTSEKLYEQLLIT